MKKILFICAFTFSHCVSKVMILQSPVVSMKKSNSQEIKSFREGPLVEEKWCANDEPAKPNDDGSKFYGMIDQVIWKAHKSTNADFFTDSRFYQQGSCVSMAAHAAGGRANPNSAEGVNIKRKSKSARPKSKS